MTHPEQPSAVPEPSRGPVGRVVVLIPTYNERENLPRIVARVRAAVPAADVLVLDDSSPDGTGAVADALAAEDDAVHVLHRRGKEGLGAAYLAGFGWALDHGYDALVEMDADGSHQPEQLPRLLEALAGADVVLGSRWVPGGAGGQLAAAPQGALGRRQPLHPGAAGHAGRRRHRRLPRLPGGRAEGAGPARRRLAGLLLPGRPRLARRAPGADGPARCRSPSSSARWATAR